MPLDNCLYKARVGRFSNCAQALSSLTFLYDQNEVISALILLALPNKIGLALSCFSYLFYNSMQSDRLAKSVNFTKRTLRPSSDLQNVWQMRLSSNQILLTSLSFAIMSLVLLDIFSYNSFHDPSFPIVFISSYLLFCKRLLKLSGDIETNPGPLQELRVVHVNARSLSTKLDLFNAESHAFDIITISESWLSNKDLNSSLLLPNFHAPVRQDRLGDRHGGVAIYVRNTLVCKPRPDLHVRGLEAVWVETKLGQQSFLVGSFYRPDSPVQYWDLIRESISKANDTLLNFVVLGDFNTDFLHNPSQHLLNILTRYNLEQLVTFPTRITENSSTCLDLIITQSTFFSKTD